MKDFRILLEEQAASSAQPHVIRLTGYLDHDNVGQFDRSAERVLASGNYRLIVEISELDYLASSGIGALVSLLLHLRRRGGNMVLVRPVPRVLQVLDVLGFAELLPIVGTVERANSILRGESR